MKTLREATDAELKAEVARFQRQQKRYAATSEVSLGIGGKLLSPLFAEMARRQRERSVTSI